MKKQLRPLFRKNGGRMQRIPFWSGPLNASKCIIKSLEV